MSSISEYLGSQQIVVEPYDQIYTKLEELKNTGKKIGIHMDTCNADLHNFCGEMAVKSDNTIKDTKCKKNATEMAGMRACNIRDCAAIMKYFAFLEEELNKADG